MIVERPASGEGRRLNAADFAVLLAVTAIGAIALAQSWNRWLDPIVDAGRDLYIPEQLRHGAKLYRDLVYFYPPLTPYLLAIVTALTGSSLGAYTAIGIVIAAATAAALYASGRIVGTRLSAGAAAVLFAACSIATPWSRGGNYLFPYAHAATIGMLLFLAFGCFLGAYLFVERKPAHLALSLACALAATWTKVEFALFTAVLVVLFAIVHRIDWRWIAAYFVALVASVGIVASVFSDAPADRTWLHGNILPEAMIGSRSLAAFYAGVGGLRNWPILLLTAIIGAGGYVLIAVLLRNAVGPQRRMILALAAIVAAFLGGSQIFFRAWSVLGIAAFIVAWKKPRSPLLLVSALAVCASSRIPLNVAPQWYGFVFCVPVYLLMAYVVFEWLPEQGVYSRQAAMIWLVAFAAAAAQWLYSANRIYRGRTHAIETARGVILEESASKADILNAARLELRRTGVRSIAIFPEGLGLNYLWALPTPLAYYTFTPPETASAVGEAHALADFEAKKPEWVAIVARDVTEFGYRGFGADYDLRLAAAIRSGYDLQRRWTASDFEFYLLRRRGGHAGATMPRSVSRE